MLGPHVIGEPGSLAAFCAQTQPGVILYLNPPDRIPYRAPITIGRDHPLSEDDGDLLRDPTGLGQRHAARLHEEFARTGITLWTGLNERNPDTPEKAAAVCRYELARVEAMNAVGLFAVVCNFGVGWPGELADHSIDWAPFAPLLGELPAGNYLGASEYWLPRPGGPLHADNLYHRAGRIFRCPFDVPILIKEAGVDVAGGQNDGFRGQGVSVERYAGELAAYAELLARDRRVKGIVVFCYRDAFGEWQTFNIEPDWRAFAAVFAAKPTTPPAPKQPIRVSTRTGVQTLELEEYLRGVVPAEMPAEYWRMPDDTVQITEMEALKAQAIAARSYALWRIAHPREAGFDLYGDTHDQVWKPDMIHARSDLAIRETAGVFIVGDVPRRYVAECGREDCVYCQGKVGWGEAAWTQRMCQYGAQAMALKGASFRAILQHYYPAGVTFSDEGSGIMDFYKDPATDAFQMGANGKVTGCRVDILKAETISAVLPGQVVMRVKSLRFIDEEQARGDTRILVTVLGANGQATMAKVVNAWPQQRRPKWDATAYDWASPAHVAEFAMGGGNYAPAMDGPLGPYVIFAEQNEAKQPVASDWCIGFGLPGNRHVAYQVVYQAVAEGSAPTPTTPDAELSGCGGVLLALAQWIESLIRK